VGLAINLAPFFAYRHQNGANPAAVARSYRDPELYGLKIIQLVLPVTGHRVAAFRNFKDQYNKGAPLVTENDSSSLGATVSVGFLLLVGWIFFGNVLRRAGPADDRKRGLVSDLSLLNLAAILLATIGGFAVVVATWVSASIRGYNRISIYIAFFSVLGLMIMLDAVRDRFAHSRRARRLFAFCTPVLLGVAILDQTTDRFIPPYARQAEDLETRALFIRMVESTLPEGAMLFQLPYMRFPENGPLESMQQYDHLAGGYLVSSRLRWSYGSVHGRDTARWQATVAAQPVPNLIDTLHSSGFSAIYVDRFGYADGAANLEAALGRVLGTQPIVSRDRRRAVYTLEAPPGAR
jgi:phosphoglycerol transferase